MKQAQKSLASRGFAFRTNAAVKKNIILSDQYGCSLPALFQFDMFPDIVSYFSVLRFSLRLNGLYLK